MNLEEVTDNMREDGYPGRWWSIYDGHRMIRLNSRDIDGDTVWKAYTTSMADISEEVDMDRLVVQVYGGTI